MDKVPKSYDGRPFVLHGRIDLDISFEGTTMQTPVYIKLDTSEPLLLSEGVCRQLRILNYHPSVIEKKSQRHVRVGNSSTEESTTTRECPTTSGSKPNTHEEAKTLQKSADDSERVVLLEPLPDTPGDVTQDGASQRPQGGTGSHGQGPNRQPPRQDGVMSSAGLQVAQTPPQNDRDDSDQSGKPRSPVASAGEEVKTKEYDITDSAETLSIEEETSEYPVSSQDGVGGYDASGTHSAQVTHCHKRAEANGEANRESPTRVNEDLSGVGVQASIPHAQGGPPSGSESAKSLTTVMVTRDVQPDGDNRRTQGVVPSMGYLSEDTAGVTQHHVPVECMTRQTSKEEAM